MKMAQWTYGCYRSGLVIVLCIPPLCPVSTVAHSPDAILLLKPFLPHENHVLDSACSEVNANACEV
jgi:hypothetical protein